MSFFEWKEWWHYRRASLGRHGVHSPFVYRFIEEALRPPLPPDVAQALRQSAASRSQFGEFATLFRCAKFLSDESRDAQRASFDFIKSAEAAPEKMKLLAEGIGIIVPGIHESPQQLGLWEEWRSDARSNLSLDLWHLGLLLFREDFKAKQHFVLRVPE
jgi:hypothetical protein